MAGDVLVEATASDGCLVVRVSGELDYVSSPVLMEELQPLIARGDRSVVLDLSGVTFCDSSGLNALLSARQQAERRGVELAVAGVPQQPRRVLQMTGADQLLPVHDTVTEAETALRHRTDRPDARG
ncbi:STAS domain-containing protein [Streptomyces sp. NPDC005329]|uniref:STAS domain-containing protein n=1 Tax=Streptomyces sp. NPDC005329 TaxID=3157034 RepID=UPI0033A96EBB